MRNLYVCLIVIALIGAGCKVGKTNKNDTKKSENMDNQFKRYTLSMRLNDDTKADLKQAYGGDKWEALKQQFVDMGGRDVSVYKLKDEAFMIMDTDMDFDYSADMKKLFKTQAFKDWDKSAGAFSFKLSDDAGWQLMERMYKLEQKHEYKAKNGIVEADTVQDYKRYCMTMPVKDDPQMIKEYKRVHSMGMAWPQITQNMEKMGVNDMEIYLRNAQAFMIMDTRPDFDYQKDSEEWGNLPGEKQWQDYVSKFQKVSPNSSIKEKWQVMEKI